MTTDMAFALWVKRTGYNALSSDALLSFAEKKVLFKKISEKDPFGLFENSLGSAVAHHLDQNFPNPENVFLFHTGQEYLGRIGQAAADWLLRWHRKVIFIDVANIETLQSLFSKNLSKIVSVLALSLDETLSPQARILIERTKYRIALDCPYGIDPDNGSAREDILQITQTIALGRWLIGTSIRAGRRLTNEYILIGQDLIPAPISEEIFPKIWLNNPALWQLPPVSASDQKYCRGGVAICGGAEMMGAARLAALAARRAGAGITWIWAEKNTDLYRIGAPGEIICDISLKQALRDLRSKVWICGPGLAPKEAKKILPFLLQNEKTILIDAGGLSYAAGHPELLKGASILTPHEGEFRKVFGDFKESERLDSVRKAAKIVNAVVLLKGEMTCIAHPDGRIALNHHATHSLATAGSGDVLSGVIGAFLAAGLSPWEAASAGAWVHGEAGLLAAQKTGGWPIAEDIVEHLGQARTTATAHP